MSLGYRTIIIVLSQLNVHTQLHVQASVCGVPCLSQPFVPVDSLGSMYNVGHKTLGHHQMESENSVDGNLVNVDLCMCYVAAGRTM